MQFCLNHSAHLMARVHRIIICWLPPNVNRSEICRVLVSRRSSKLGPDSHLFVTSLPGHNYDHNIDRLTQSFQDTTTEKAHPRL